MDKHKMIDDLLIFCLAGFVCMALSAFPIAYLPHYEKAVYEKQEPLTRESMEELIKEQEERDGEFYIGSFTGYPTEGIHTELASYEQFEEKMYEQFFCLEVDAADLEPTGLYELVYESKMITGGDGGVGIRRNPNSYSGTVGAKKYLDSYVKTVLNRHRGIYGQYYALKLDDGSRILVLLNDTMLDIPEKGVIQLPYAAWGWLDIDAEGADVRNLIVKYHLKYNRQLNEVNILDASRRWLFLNKDMEAAVEGRTMLGLTLFCIGTAGALIVILGSAVFLKRVK